MAMAGPPQVTTLLDSLDRSVDLLLFYNKYDRRQQNATPSIFNLMCRLTLSEYPVHVHVVSAFVLYLSVVSN